MMSFMSSQMPGALAACRKRLFTVALVCCVSCFSVNAQVVDGRDFSIDGFAAVDGNAGTNHYRAGGTTGGAGGKVVYAANFSQLQAYMQAKDPYIVIVDKDMTTGITCYVDGLNTGKLCDVQDGSQGVPTTYGERILVAPNKTLIGVTDPKTGNAPLFSRITFVMQCVDNVIIRNCRFTMNGVPVLKSGENKIVAFRNGVQTEVGDLDCIGIQADKVSAKTDWGGHIWIDHCEFFNGNAASKDRYDGLLDCKNNVQWMTFSYNHFHNHDKSCLFGKGDSDVYENCRTISFHHNFFENIEGSRLPLQRGGNLHFYNNYMLGCEDGWDVRPGAVGCLEASYFENTKSPVRSDRGGSLNVNKTSGYDVIYKGCNNLMEGYTNTDGHKISKSYPVTATKWTPVQTSSSYRVNNLDKTADVPELLKKYAGAREIEIYKAYTDNLPGEDINEFAHAVKNKLTGDAYDDDGNKITDVPTAIDGTVAGGMANTVYYTLDGVRVNAPEKGVYVRKAFDAQGRVSVSKVVIR